LFSLVKNKESSCSYIENSNGYFISKELLTVINSLLLSSDSCDLSTTFLLRAARRFTRRFA